MLWWVEYLTLMCEMVIVWQGDLGTIFKTILQMILDAYSLEKWAPLNRLSWKNTDARLSVLWQNLHVNKAKNLGLLDKRFLTESSCSKRHQWTSHPIINIFCPNCAPHICHLLFFLILFPLVLFYILLKLHIPSTYMYTINDAVSIQNHI